ncbi:MAG: patatin-like phospholipase family protein [Pyrinomonadaceae bacterium]
MARKKIGLALSGGAARGFAHIGVLRVFEEEGIPIDYVSGTSAGSIVGGGFAAGLRIEELVELGSEISWFRISGVSFPVKGLISNQPLGKIVEEKFPVKRFEDLRIPFAAIATQLETGEEVVFKNYGDLDFAIRASCAIPGIFAPLIDENKKMYVDGGVVSPVPSKAVKEMGADIVVSVDLLSCGASYWGTPSTVIGVIFQSAMILLKTVSTLQHNESDVIISPDIAHLRPDEIGKMAEFIELGERAARARVDEIKRLAEI